ncbi:hypothetical protein [Streptomyces californicus]|uniref:hypothetical protein n=1 Tax=Streptomyces californicus TaxID=67351 RepID=UPI0036FA744C
MAPSQLGDVLERNGRSHSRKDGTIAYDWILNHQGTSVEAGSVRAVDENQAAEFAMRDANVRQVGDSSDTKEAKPQPDRAVIEEARTARAQLAREREALRSSDREQIAAARRDYAQLASDVRHRCTERTLTRRSLAITELASPWANLSTALRRNSSRNCCRSAVSPLPCGYRMPR